MTKEDIIRMAQEAGFTEHNGFCEVIVRHSNGSWIGIKDKLERFAALVASTERNRCVARADIALLGADITLRNRVLKAINIKGGV